MEKKLIWGLVGSSRIKKYSIAPEMWNHLFKFKEMSVECVVINSDISSEISLKLQKLLRNSNFIGCNVALPWKYLVYEFCDIVESSAEVVRAVNTLVNSEKCIEGYNTDGEGLLNGIEENISLKGKVILLIGCGSSAQTVPYHLSKRKIKKLYVVDIIRERARKLSSIYSPLYRNRKIDIVDLSYKNIDSILNKVDILINMTPCGMKDFIQRYPIDKNKITKLKQTCVLVESVYNPYKTPLLDLAEKRGYKIIPGIKMLVEQAALSFYYAFRKKLTGEDKKVMEKSALKALRRK